MKDIKTTNLFSIEIATAETCDLEAVRGLEAEGYTLVNTRKESLGHGPNGVYWLPTPKTIYILERIRK